MSPDPSYFNNKNVYMFGDMGICLRLRYKEDKLC